MSVGTEVKALCRKCGEVWHTVIAMAGGKMAQVECKPCGARHRYRSPEGVTAAATPATPRAKAKRSTGTRSRSAPKKLVVVANLTRPPRPFQATDTYQAGDRVLHTNFGEGVVQAVTGTTKVEILFAEGSKTLVHGRSATL